MKSLLTILIFLFAISCSKNGSENEDISELSCSISLSSSSEIRISSSSSAAGLDSFRMWILDKPFGKITLNFSNLKYDTAFIQLDSAFAIFRREGEIKAYLATPQPWAGDSLGWGYFDLPDSTFLRGDTIQYRLAYTLDGKLDSTAWQEYVFLGNHTQLIFGKDTTLIQQFDSIQYPIVLGPQDSCGKALMSSILTYSIVDTFDYESNWDALFSDGREYISDYDPFCHGDPQFKMAFFTLMSYEGDINDAAKAIQKVNPRFFITLTPWCEELTACETVQTQ